nr:MAG TPA: helix-turn-helix protein [Caudoviricetes sp.]
MENKLGNFLREKRGSTSLRDFAKKLDISHTYLDSIEKGYDSRNKKPLRITVDTLSKIAKALDEPLDKLVAYSENKDYNPQIGDIYMHLAKEAQDLNLDKEDVDYIINLYKKYKR